MLSDPSPVDETFLFELIYYLIIYNLINYINIHNILYTLLAAATTGGGKEFENR